LLIDLFIDPFNIRVVVIFYPSSLFLFLWHVRGRLWLCY